MNIPNILLKTFCRMNQGLHICHLNVRSLCSCLDEVKDALANSGVDILCISETWLGSHIDDRVVSIPGYKIFRSDRFDRRGGGVLSYVKENIKVTLLESASIYGEEFLLLEVLASNTKLLIGCNYCPPKSTNTEFINKLSTYAGQYEHIIIAGDFNKNLLGSSTLVSRFVDAVSSLGLDIVDNRIPTHQSYNSSALLDFFIVSLKDSVVFKQQFSCPYTDHDLIFITYDLPQEENMPSTEFYYRDIKSANVTELYDDCLTLAWDTIYSLAIEEKIDIFNSFLRYLFEKHVPLKLFKPNNKAAPWITRDIRNLIAVRDMLYARWRRNKSSHNWSSYRLARNVVVDSIKKAKRAYYDGKICLNNTPNKLWKDLRKLGAVSSAKSGCQIDANALNLHFSSTNSLAPTIPVVNNLSRAQRIDQFYFDLIDDFDIVCALKSIKSDATGFEDVPTRFVKLISPCIIPYIRHLYNCIIDQDRFPNCWKRAKVTPIPKVRAPKSPDDYRPISILPFLSKIVERIMANQMIAFVESRHQLYNNQSGFRRNRSALSALLKVTEDIRQKLDENKVAILTLLDFSKAFDSVDHNLLIYKLKSCFHFADKTQTLLRSYLQGRTQTVCTDSGYSEFTHLECGVPQGSILGPILFLLFINDLPQVLPHRQSHIYADDFQFYRFSCLDSIDECIASVNSDLQLIYDWSCQNGLKLNAKKSQALVIYRRSIVTMNLRNLHINSENIKYVSKAKNLGVFFSNNFSWSDHIDYIVGRVYASLRSLWASAKYLSTEIRKRLIVALIMPIISYCNPLFSAMDAGSLQKLQVAFNSCTRFVYRLRRYDHVSALSNRILGMSLCDYFKLHKCIFMFKIILFRSPSYLYENLQFLRSNRSYNLLVPRAKFVQTRNTFFFQSVLLWNQIPNAIKNSCTITAFSNSLRAHLAPV